MTNTNKVKKFLDTIRPSSHKALIKKYGTNHFRQLALKRWKKHETNLGTNPKNK